MLEKYRNRRGGGILKEIKVCDAIMGSGKTQSTINLINTHPDYKFVYISPYLDEADRISDGCPDAKFVKPSNKISAFNFSKVEHTKYLLSEGMNIATSHVAFKLYTADMIKNIRDLCKNWLKVRIHLLNIILVWMMTLIKKLTKVELF